MSMSERMMNAASAKQQPSFSPAPALMLQRACECGTQTNGGGCEGCTSKKRLQRSLAAEAFGSPVPSIVSTVLNSPGAPLDPSTRAFMEPRFGRDFSSIRVHTDSLAAESARAVKSRAYTVGQDIVFGAGFFNPSRNEGRRLIAHELAHTIQQRGQASGAPQMESLQIGEPNDSYEREADDVADR